MAEPASSKPIVHFQPVFKSSSIEANNPFLKELYQSIEASQDSYKVCDKMKCLALIYFAQYAEAFNGRRLQLNVFEGPSDRKVVVFNVSEKEFKIVFKEKSEAIYRVEKNEALPLYESAGLDLVIYGESTLGKMLAVWNKTILDAFLRKPEQLMFL